jgi:hypothetical protein
MSVSLYTEMFKKDDAALPNWSNIRRLISSPARHPLHHFLRAHETTYKKFKFAIYHLTIFQQIYGVSRNDVSKETSAPQYWAIAEAHSIIFNLYSALDAVGHEINLAYNFRLNPNDIRLKNRCLRYMIDNENDALTPYLRDSLDQQSWFKHFSKLRNQMAHRNLTIFQIISGGNTVK